jgi:cytoskeletal protein RodZ
MTRSGELAIVELQTQMTEVNNSLERIEKKLEFSLVRMIVYGMVGAILLFVLNGWLGLFKLPQIQVVAPGTSSGSTPSGSSSAPSASANAAATSDGKTTTDSEKAGVVDTLKEKIGL